MHTTVLKAVESELGCALESLGSSALLSRPRCAILVSRGERTPEPLSPQLLEALGAARAISARGAVLVCGAGRVIWDAALLACRESKGSALVVLAQRPDDAELRELHSFLPADRLLVWPQFERTKLLTPTMLLVRDMLVGLLAESAVAIQVRANGNMAAVCAEMRKRGGQIEERILQPQAKIKTAPRAQAIESKSAAGVADIESFEHRLTHFTRAPDGAWPGEAHVDYLRWLCGAERSEMRDGFAALKRILSERRIRACGRLIADSDWIVP